MISNAQVENRGVHTRVGEPWPQDSWLRKHFA